MRWTALDADTGTLDTGLAFNRARSVAEFVAASARHVAPMQNMVVADREGHIGFVAAGRVPLRRPDNDLKGLVPAPGWDARYDWAGFLDAALTPREIDPPRGWIATANQRIHAADYAHFLSSEWALPYRQQRIEQLLEGKPKHSLDTFRAMQADLVSPATQRLLPFLRKAHSSHPLGPAVEKTLASFDGTMAADQAAPLVFWAWTRQLTQGVFADEIGEPLYTRTLANRSFRDALEGVLERNDAWWCDDKSTPAVETCAQQADAALTRAIDELALRFGSDVSRWRWGDAHAARSEHRPFSRVKALARWFELRSPVGGDTYTINVSRVGLRPDATTGELYLDEHGPSLRALYDVGDPARSLVMHSSGQSGIVFSALYRAFVQHWARVEYVPLWGGTAERTLVLQPAP
jgi:penicillin amidase